MIVRIITVRVKSDRVSEFASHTIENHRASLAEPGVLRFDVLQDREDSTVFYLYEVYADEAATLAHKETKHYATWKSAVAEMMEGDRSAVPCDVVAPKDPERW